MNKLLFKSGLRYLYRNPWQSILSIVGIALGVAVVVAIDLANVSSSKAFDLSMQSISGNSTHQIKGTTGLADTIFRIIRKDLQISKSAPVIEKLAVSETVPPKTFTLMGIDPISESFFRPYLADRNSLGVGIEAFISTRKGVLISNSAAKQLNLDRGDSLKIRIDGNITSLYILGILLSTDENINRAIENLIVCDIGNAQMLTAMPNMISYIDLIINDSISAKI